MDSAGGSYMQYNNANHDDLSQFFNEVSDYTNSSNDPQSQFDPALFADGGLASFSAQQTQPSQPTHQNFSQSQTQPQSQSPALPQFKPTSNPYSPPHFNQNVYNPQAMGQQFDPRLLSRPTPSPGPFDQYPYQPQHHMNYSQGQFDYAFNSFQPSRQAATAPQTYQPQAQQPPQHYMNIPRPPSQSQSQSHVSQQAQAQTISAMPYHFPQNHQMQQRFVEPSLLNQDTQIRQTQPPMIQSRQMETQPYFAAANGKLSGATLDPRALQMQQQYQQLHQAQGLAPVPHQMNSMQHVFQSQSQNLAVPAMKANTKPKPKKEGKASGSAASSGDDLDIEVEEPPEPRPDLIKISKPSDEREKLLWEIVDAVWTPRNKPAPPETIRSAITFVGNTVRNLRDKWKQTNEQLKQAELPASSTKELAVGLKDTAAHYRDTMETLAARVARFGHPSILRSLGEHQFLLSALYSFLLDRVNAEDYNSTLVEGILLLGTRIENIDEEQLEKVKWTKILLRFSKKSTNNSKILAQQIVNNAKKATARKKVEATTQGPASPSGNSTNQVAGVKRPREGSEIMTQVKKLTVRPSSKPLSVQLAEQRKMKEREKASAAKDAKSEKSATNGTNGGVAPARPKVTTALPPKASPFASLMSASKKPGTSNAERAAKDKFEPIKQPTASVAFPPKNEPVTKAEIPAPKATVTTGSAPSFLGFLADMEKPKETPKVKVDDDPNETAEARAKRLHKESRRRLRVSWKPEGQLVETRVFEHDPDEETGHDDSMMRDVGDTGKEGEMLKRNLHIEESDEDSDEELEYYLPSEVDFVILKERVQQDRPGDELESVNYSKYGGHLKPESSSSAAQARHEEGNIMTVYAAGEQPNTPKEPPEFEDDDFDPALDFGEAQEVFVRQREQALLARRYQYQQPSQPQTHTNEFDLSTALSGLFPQQQQQQQQQQQHTQSQQQDWLRALGLPTQQAQLQPQVSSAGTPQFDLSKLLAAAAQAQQQQQNPYQPPATTMTSTSLAPNIAALLGQIQQSSSIPNPNQSSDPSTMIHGDNATPFPGSMASKQDKKKDKKRGKSGAPLGPDGLPVNYKTKICQFWLEGKCTKGDNCTYRHDREGGDG